MRHENAGLPPHTIGSATARTLPGLFRQRVERTPDAVAYSQFEGTAWRDYTWSAMAGLVGRWQRGLAAEGLRAGDRVALSLPNGIDWVCCDLASLGLGLVPVPLYAADSPDNIAHILADSAASLLVLDSDRRWSTLRDRSFPALRRVLCLTLETEALETEVVEGPLRRLADWLPGAPAALQDRVQDPESLATLVYTSGTTGRSKGVMQSHRGILWTAEAVLRRIPAYPTDTFLSFLPLAHSFERTVGYYLPMMAGARVCYARSVELLRQDLLGVRPTVLLGVPRVYERVYLVIQARLGQRGFKRWLLDTTVDLGWRRFLAAQGLGPHLNPPERLAAALLRRLIARQVLDKFGGRLRVAVSGGAPLTPTVARFFIGLGLPLTEGYGLTETSPVLTNTRPEDCRPGSVGRPLPGIQVRIAEDGELLARTPGLMLGYWGQPAASACTIDADGWLHTGDLAELRDGYIHIRARLKEILVTSAGEKVPPAALEQALTMDPLIAQAMIVGEGRPWLAALLVLAPEPWRHLATGLGLDPDDPESLRAPAARAALLSRVQDLLKTFPLHAQVRAVSLSLDPWTIENGLLTPTLKVKRARLEAQFHDPIRRLYGGREVPGASPSPALAGTARAADH